MASVGGGVLLQVNWTSKDHLYKAGSQISFKHDHNSVTDTRYWWWYIILYLFFRHGAEVLESERVGKKPKKLTFGGTGYRLGLTQDDTEGETLLFI